MSNISYSDFINIGKSWELSDDEQLIKLYNDDNLEVLQIAIKLKRAPGGILARLRKLNIIENKKSAKGYEDYVNSNLYKEACEISKNRYTTKEKTNIEISKDNIIKSFRKVNKNMGILQKKINDYNNLNLNEEDNNYNIVIIKDNEYFLIDNQIYKIIKIKGELYGNYDSDKNKVIKIKNGN